MSALTASWLAWSMCALSLALTAVSLLLLVLNLSYPDVPIHPYWTVNTLLAVGFAPVGAVIVSRSSPENPIGWLFCVIGFLWGWHTSAPSTPSTPYWQRPAHSQLVKQRHG